MTSRWIILVAASLSGAATLDAQETVTYLSRRAAVLQDTASTSEFERLRRLIGLAPRPRPTRLVFLDTANKRRCPMPVAVPDTTKLSPMPSDRRDSSRTVVMPTARVTCINPLFRP